METAFRPIQLTQTELHDLNRLTRISRWAQTSGPRPTGTTVRAQLAATGGVATTGNIREKSASAVIHTTIQEYPFALDARTDVHATTSSTPTSPANANGLPRRAEQRICGAGEINRMSHVSQTMRNQPLASLPPAMAGNLEQTEKIAPNKPTMNWPENYKRKKRDETSSVERHPEAAVVQTTRSTPGSPGEM